MTHNPRNLTIPGRLKPRQEIIYGLADEAAELAKTVQREPWRKLALRAAVSVSQAKQERFARLYLDRIHEYIEKERRFGRK